VIVRLLVFFVVVISTFHGSCHVPERTTQTVKDFQNLFCSTFVSQRCRGMTDKRSQNTQSSHWGFCLCHDKEAGSYWDCKTKNFPATYEKRLAIKMMLRYPEFFKTRQQERTDFGEQMSDMPNQWSKITDFPLYAPHRVSSI